MLIQDNFSNVSISLIFVGDTELFKVSYSPNVPSSTVANIKPAHLQCKYRVIKARPELELKGWRSKVVPLSLKS